MRARTVVLAGMVGALICVVTARAQIEMGYVSRNFTPVERTESAVLFLPQGSVCDASPYYDGAGTIDDALINKVLRV
jgi:hypothetical protein